MVIQQVKCKMFILFFLSLIMIAGLAGVTHSAVITVKQLGGGDYDTIGEAITNAFQDDIVEVYAGHYEETVVIDSNLTLKGMGPQKVIIDSPADGITVNDNRSATISGFSITAANNCIKLNFNVNAVIKNNCLVDCGNDGIWVCGPGGGGATAATITNNTIAYNGGDGIEQSCNNYNASFIKNNIIYRNSNCGINRLNGTVTNSFNDVYQNTDNYCNCTAHATDISDPPGFLNLPIGNCILQSASPCVNAGSPGLAEFDPDGSRNDMGAYGGYSSASFWPYPAGAPIITILNATPTSVPKGSPINIEATGEVYE